MRCGPARGWCGNVRAGEAYTRDQCDRCWLMTHSPDHRAGWGVEGPATPAPVAAASAVEPRRPLVPNPATRPKPVTRRLTTPLPVVVPCEFEGAVIEACKTCGDKEGRHVRACYHDDNPTETCTRDHPKTRVWNCATCEHHTARRLALPPPAYARVDPAGLTRSRDRGPFNGGEVAHRGRRFLAYRVGLFDSRTHVAELDAAGNVVRDVRLDLTHPEAVDGQEDPAPFVFRDRLHVAFVGVWKRGRDVATSQLYARLADDLSVEAVYAPRYAGRAWPKEKNWGFFDHGGELFAVYSVSPHVVLHIDGDRAERGYVTPYPFPWAGGHLRGGAPPVRVADRYYHWIHGKIDRTRPLYSVGVYTFAAAPPFAPLAGTPAPLLWSDDAEAQRLKCPYSVVFPRGAVLRNGAWEVTGGEYDTRLARWTWDAGDVDRLLAPAGE